MKSFLKNLNGLSFLYKPNFAASHTIKMFSGDLVVAMVLTGSKVVGLRTGEIIISTFLECTL